MQKLGQHFLENQSVLKKIADAVGAEPGETIIEIGAGHGELTEEIENVNLKIKNGDGGFRIVAIEKDRLLVEALKKKFGRRANVEIIEGDALKMIPNLAKSYNLKARSYVIVGNIPYYLTGRLFRVIGDLNPKPARCVLTIQKEVAERICAAPPRMNRLAALVRYWADPTLLHAVPRTAFRPQPKVTSAVILLRPTTAVHPGVPWAAYQEFVRLLFQQPRKTIANNLRAAELGRAHTAAVLTACCVAPDLRPGDLDIGRIGCLAAHATPSAPPHAHPRP